MPTVIVFWINPLRDLHGNQKLQAYQCGTFQQSGSRSGTYRKACVEDYVAQVGRLIP
ncbi:hypothetical protein RYH72_003883 [Pseudomonas syringae pv. actinidiae]